MILTVIHTYTHTLMVVAAMQGAGQHIRSSLGISILPKDTSTCRPGESNQQAFVDKTLALNIGHLQSTPLLKIRTKKTFNFHHTTCYHSSSNLHTVCLFFSFNPLQLLGLICLSMFLFPPLPRLSTMHDEVNASHRAQRDSGA